MKNNLAVAYVRINHDLDHDCIEIRDKYVKRVEQYCKANCLNPLTTVADRHEVNCECPSWVLTSRLEDLVTTFSEAEHFICINKHHLGRTRKEFRQVLRMLNDRKIQVHFIEEI